MNEKVDAKLEDESRWAAFMRASQEGDSAAFGTLLREILPGRPGREQ